MKITLKYLHWLFFWFGACLPLTTVFADASALAASSLVQNIASTEPGFETLRDAESIDHQAITALAQDARGPIWIGTQTGLVRYDGYHFRKFVHKPEAPFSLAGDFIYSLYAAADGRIWVGTFNDGVSVFDPGTERFEHFRHDEKVPDSLGGGRIWTLTSDGAGGMWFATDQGLDHLPSGSSRFAHFRHGTQPRSLMANQVRSLLRDKTGHLWVGSSSGLQRLGPDGKNFDTIVTGRDVRSLFQAQDGKLWLGTFEHGAGWIRRSKVRRKCAGCLWRN